MKRGVDYEVATLTYNNGSLMRDHGITSKDSSILAIKLKNKLKDPFLYTLYTSALCPKPGCGMNHRIQVPLDSTFSGEKTITCPKEGCGTSITFHAVCKSRIIDRPDQTAIYLFATLNAESHEQKYFPMMLYLDMLL